MQKVTVYMVRAHLNCAGYLGLERGHACTGALHLVGAQTNVEEGSSPVGESLSWVRAAVSFNVKSVMNQIQIL